MNINIEKLKEARYRLDSPTKSEFRASYFKMIRNSSNEKLFQIEIQHGYEIPGKLAESFEANTYFENRDGGVLQIKMYAMDFEIEYIEDHFLKIFNSMNYKRNSEE